MLKFGLKHSSLSGLELLTLVNEPAIKQSGALYSKVQQKQQPQERIDVGVERGSAVNLEWQLSQTF